MERRGGFGLSLKPVSGRLAAAGAPAEFSETEPFLKTAKRTGDL
jgi:hypothetical protein